MNKSKSSNFWIRLVQKILRIIAKDAFGPIKKTHHQHVVPHEDGWAVKGEGNERYTGVFDTQKRAMRRAREIAENYGSDVIIHGRDGAIRDRHSYKDQD